MDEKMERVFSLLDLVINDRTVPKNIRKVAEDAKKTLSDENQPADLKLSSAIHMLDEIINDLNMPMYARTKIWNVVSILEEKRKEVK
ncbi:MAG: UPF0147 family protein [Candidatus Aenigmatarchaeota archaeon]